ncbi:MAG: hypothetical protein NZM09_11025 [Ignavibacterium sp.]|nr:hypothetical protein [Ignavibacterium sp.]MDW8376210.1 hypothetical protein [Ignavibacteriales bacterium]
MKKILPSVISGFGAAVLSVVPVIKAFSCCLFVPLATIIALLLDIRVNRNLEKITLSKAIYFGFLTGFFITLFFVGFDIIITFTTRTNDFVEALPQSEILIKELNLGKIADEPLALMRSISQEIKDNGFSLFYTFILFISNFITNVFWGIIGGIVGMGLLNKKLERIDL